MVGGWLPDFRVPFACAVIPQNGSENLEIVVLRPRHEFSLVLEANDFLDIMGARPPYPVSLPDLQ